MSKSLFTVLILSAFLSVAGNAQSHKKFSIPFELTPYNNIAVKVVLNRQDTLVLMLATASSDVTISEEAMAHVKTLHFNGSVDGVQSWGGNANTSDYSTRNSIDIGGLHRDSVTIWKDLQSGQGTFGKFGLNLFKGKVVELDFDRKLLIVHPALPRKSKRYERLQWLPPGEDMMVRGVCRIGTDTLGNAFLIHSGYGGALLLDDDFAAKNKLETAIKITSEKKLQDAFGNVITVKKGVLPGFDLGKYQLKDTPAGFFAGAIGRQTMSILGGDVFKRFNWIIDTEGGYLYFRPNGLFDLPFSNI